MVPQVSRRQRDHSRQPSPGRPDDSANTDPVSVRHKLAKLTTKEMDHPDGPAPATENLPSKNSPWLGGTPGESHQTRQEEISIGHKL